MSIHILDETTAPRHLQKLGVFCGPKVIFSVFTLRVVWLGLHFLFLLSGGESKTVRPFTVVDSPQALQHPGAKLGDRELSKPY